MDPNANNVQIVPPASLQESKPHRCPVCEGRGNVPHGFYSRSQVATNLEPEKCRSCDGKGIVWSVLSLSIQSEPRFVYTTPPYVDDGRLYKEQKYEILCDRNTEPTKSEIQNVLDRAAAKQKRDVRHPG